MDSRYGVLIAPLVGLLAWIGLSAKLPPFVLPGPLEVLHFTIASWEALAVDALITTGEAILGLVLAMGVAAILASTINFLPAARGIVMPWAIAVKSTPVVAIAPLLVLWFGNGLPSKVILSSAVCFFPLLIALVDGLVTPPKSTFDLAAIWGANRWQIFLHIQIPHCASSFASGVRIATPLAVVGAVVAEYSGAVSGLGHRILVSAYRADATSLLSATILAAAVGYCLYALADWFGDAILCLVRTSHAS